MKRLSLPPAKQREAPHKPFVGTPRWDDTQYNTVVKYVELASDHLRNVLESFEPYSKRDATARFIMKRLKAAIANLDLEALKMLAPYDPFAVHQLHHGAKRDSRRPGLEVCVCGCGCVRSIRVSGTANVIDMAKELAKEPTPEGKQK